MHEPTRGLNPLDLIMTDLPGDATVNTLAPLGNSDHACVLADFHVSTAEEPPVTRTVWRYQRADWDRLRHFFRTTDWQSTVSDDPDAMCMHLTQNILEGMRRYIPSKQLCMKPSNPSWWTPECTEAVAQKQRAWRRLCADRSSAQLQARYNVAKHSANHCLATAKQAFTASLAQKLASGCMASGEWWRTIKKASGHGNSPSIPTLRSTDGTEHDTNRSKAECMAEHFANKCSLGADDLSAPFPYVRPRTDRNLCTVRFRETTVERTLRQLNPTKATGPDGIPAPVLKACSAELARPLSKLFTCCLRSGIQPQHWKVANVVPVHKRKSKSSPSNYRPVSLLSILSKVMETIVNRAMSNFMETNHVLSERQFGFRRGHSAADLLTALHHQWVHTAGDKGASRVLAIDIAGAFDRVSHTGVLHKARVYGILGDLHRWLQDYLCNRTLQVLISGQTSARRPVKAGVPQGSILGPTLFLVYVNDLEDHLPIGSNLASFADDTTLYAEIATLAAVPDNARVLPAAVDLVSSWGSDWKVQFEPAKSQALTISHHRRDWPIPPIVFNGTPVEEQPSIKVLGVTFDHQLKFSQHIRTVVVRATQRLGALHKAFHLLTIPARLRAYKAFVRPVMEYCPIVWMGAASSHLNRLDWVQERAIKAIHPQCWLPSLIIRRTIAALCLLYKALCDNSPALLSRMAPPPTHQPRTTRLTRQAVRLSTAHPHQLQNVLPANSRNNVSRAFPHSVIPIWNQLPTSIIPHPFHPKNIQKFKTAAYHHLLRTNWP